MPHVAIAALCSFSSGWGCAPSSPGEPQEQVTAPPDLEALDLAVREQFDEIWAACRSESEAGADCANAESWGVLGQWFETYGYASSARISYGNASRLAPQEGRWPYHLGRLAQEAGELDLAERLYRISALAAPTAVAPRVRLGDLALQRADLAGASAWFEQVLAERPDEPGARFGRARLDLESGAVAGAAEMLAELSAEQPEAADVRYVLARAWSELGDPERAAKALARVPQDNLDQTLLRWDDPWLTEVQKMDLGSRTWTRLGVRAHRAGDPRKAARLFQRAVQADPDGAEERLNFGIALREAGSMAAAEQHLRAALERTEPQGDLAARAHLELGRLMARTRRPAQALEQYTAALTAQPQLLGPHLEIARLRHFRGEYEAALEAYENARVQASENRQVQFWQAALLVLLERHEDALALLSADLGEISAAEGARPQQLLLTRLLVASPQKEMRNLGRARELLARIEVDRAAPDPLYAATAAMVEAEGGDFVQALEWQSKAVEALAGGKPEIALRIARRRQELYRVGEPSRSPWEPREAIWRPPVARP